MALAPTRYPPFVVRISLPLLLLLMVLAAAVTAADEGPEPTFLVENATVLLSEGAPEAVRELLPENEPAVPLAVPLPDGPLVILGLPNEDELADDLVRLWGLLPPDGDLHGGYVTRTWHDGERPISAVFADDGVALRVACERLSNVQSVPAAWHHERPRYRIRALHPRGPLDAAIACAITERANRFWLDPTRYPRSEIGSAIPRLVAHGIRVVAVVRSTDHPAYEALTLAREHGIRCLAFGVDTAGGTDAHAAVARLEAGLGRCALRAEELVVVPGGIGDTHRVVEGVCPNLSHVDGVLLGWRSPAIFSTRIEAAWARTARSESRAPLVLIDDWACGYGSQPEPHFIPTYPRGRDPALAVAATGIVVEGGPGAALVLRDAWKARPTPEPWETHLLPLLPRQRLEPRAFLRQAADRLHAAVAAGAGQPWMRPLAAHLERRAASLSPTALGVPRVPCECTRDGVLDERAWAYATRRTIRWTEAGAEKTFDLLVYADGRDLHLAARSATVLEDLHVVVADPEVGLAGFVHSVGRRYEWLIPGDSLGADAYPGRVIDLELRGGERGRVVWRETLVLMP